MGPRLTSILYGVTWAAVAFSATGCATVFHGTTETVRIESEPSGAYVIENEQLLGRTPLEVDLDSDEGHALVLRAEGYQDAWVAVETQPLIGYYVLDVLLTFGLGIYVDAATGAIVGFEANDFYVRLAPVGQPTDSRGHALPPGVPGSQQPPRIQPAPPPDIPEAPPDYQN